MIRTVIWFIYFGLVLPCTLPFLPSAKRRTHLARYAFVQRVASVWANSLLRLAGVRVNVTGREHIPANEPVVFISNHQGNFDVPILLGKIDKPKAFISKIEVNKIPIVNVWMNLMGCVMIDRKDRRQSLKAIRSGVDTIKDGQSMIIFPEGTRSKGGPMAEFKAGSFTLATSSGARVVPVAISGSYRVMEKTGKIRPATVEVTILPSIDPSTMTQKELVQTVEQQIKQIIEGA
ncbi:1-acyl-sn-glycerol-3-phosphate acyltransferase [uncultured Exiguobacterium sp.]|uniref:lysophospholipid acyltransferase family protein n=1 Tax=uncultured Exiguobacterium sp. TaxID=202669 RepID=UPI0025EDAD87|nr:lysophospholipid acyltransferase family protein [uncultured Exiguobacterium sp.]